MGVRVSVVVSTFNKKEMVADCIRSILDQTFRDFEIVVSDDGSTDGTPYHVFREFQAQPKAIEILARQSPGSIRPFSHIFTSQGIPIQYHYCQSRGLSTARNRGIKAARGEYIAFLEAEDLWDERHLATQMAFIEANPATRVCYVTHKYVGEDRKRRLPDPETPDGWIFRAALERSPMCTSGVLVHRSCFAECGTFDENLPACEDYDMWVRLSAHYQIRFVEGVTVARRAMRRDGSPRAWSWDRFRVYALEKAFQSGRLTIGQRLLVAEEIVRKCERLVEGFKRQKSEERSNFYERKRRRFAQEVRKLRASVPAAAH